MRSQFFLFVALFFSIKSFALEIKTLDGHQFDPNNVYYRGARALSLVGMIDLSRANEYLRPFGLAAAELRPNSAVVNISVIKYDTVVGCGCPSAFMEYYAGIIVQPRGPVTADKINIATINAATNHVTRQLVMGQKFATLYDLNRIALNPNDLSAQVQDLAGDPILKLKVNQEIESYGPGGIDVYFSTLGETLGKTTLQRSFYRVLSENEVAKPFFDRHKDVFEVNPQSLLGKTLTTLKFVPVQWEVYKYMDTDQGQLGKIHF